MIGFIRGKGDVVVFVTRANVEGHHDWCPGDLASGPNWYH